MSQLLITMCVQLSNLQNYKSMTPFSVLIKLCSGEQSFHESYYNMIH